ncbi:MAG: histidine--tRNA ligase [Bacteroidetes bacterium GWF2_49_14]|nr:MAG: histidine--tRNA ligase [Bacteroidetes bacterium GWF2_49_14]HBB93336.1 histidine--tRNA ligase [Bacteroidales bacterium]
MNQKPTLPKGTRDFGPIPMMRRNYIFNTIRTVFELFGYQPIETPAMETLETLTGKYGEEGDKLIFKILNSGDFAGAIKPEIATRLQNDPASSPEISRSLAPKLAEKALRYDLTVPFARFVVQHRDEITFPFKRYQIQPVWRADRPQKGRYREFYQCDVDVIGSDSLLNEAELIRIIDEVFLRLKTRIIIKINNRKILAGMAEVSGYPDRLTDITIALDKLDKIGIEEVKNEWVEKGLSKESFEKIRPVITLSGSNEVRLKAIADFAQSSETGRAGILEITEVFSLLKDSGVSAPIEFDLSLARGLNYYTGAIIEVKSADIAIGSICGGGRYDDLTGIFGMPGVSGVGVSFGADRIYDVLEHSKAFPPMTQTTTQVLFLNFGSPNPSVYNTLADACRKRGIRTEIFPDPSKIKKQMQYADNNHIPIVVMIGENEWALQQAAVKNMNSGTQVSIGLVDLSDHIYQSIL